MKFYHMVPLHKTQSLVQHFPVLQKIFAQLKLATSFECATEWYDTVTCFKKINPIPPLNPKPASF